MVGREAYYERRHVHPMQRHTAVRKMRGKVGKVQVFPFWLLTAFLLLLQ